MHIGFGSSPWKFKLFYILEVNFKQKMEGGFSEMPGSNRNHWTSGRVQSYLETRYNFFIQTVRYGGLPVLQLVEPVLSVLSGLPGGFLRSHSITRDYFGVLRSVGDACLSEGQAVAFKKI